MFNRGYEWCFVFKVHIPLLIAEKDLWDSETSKWGTEGMCRTAKGYMKMNTFCSAWMNKVRFNMETKSFREELCKSDHFLLTKLQTYGKGITVFWTAVDSRLITELDFYFYFLYSSSATRNKFCL